MAQLAIKGHATRGKEVIEILEMLGGKSYTGLAYKGEDPDRFYCINKVDNFIDAPLVLTGFQVFTLEEFLEKYPYKIGDMIRVPEFESEVRINDMNWDGYNIQYEVFTDETEWYTAEELNNWNTKNIKKGPEYKIGEKVIYNGDVVEITKNHQHIDQHTSYSYHNGTLRSSSFEEPKKINQNPLLQQLKKYFEETPIDVIEKEWNELSYLNEIGPTVEEYLECVKKYRQTQYPKTYEECCGILKIPNDERYIDVDVPLDYNKLLSAFTELLICRDAYWKIAGEQMGLGKPWEPDWNDGSEEKHCIEVRNDNELCELTYLYAHRILAFPTIKLFDIFAENFKDLIGQCKELL